MHPSETKYNIKTHPQNLKDIINLSVEDDDSDIKNSKYYYNSELIDALKKENFFTILTLNCQSISAKFQEFQIYIESLISNSCIPGVICIQETWLDDNSDMSLIQLKNYTLLPKGRSCSLHGGIAMYIHNMYKFTELCIDFGGSNWDGQLIEIHMKNNQKFIICNVYRPPRNNVSDIAGFTDDLAKIFNYLDKEKNVVVVGDFNIDLLKIHANQHINEYFENIITAGYIPCLTLPTRLTSTSGTLIDNIFIKLQNKYQYFSGSLISNLSDHLPCFTAFRCEKPTAKNTHIKISVSTNEAMKKIKLDLNKVEVRENLNNLNSPDININYNELNNILQTHIRKHFQTKTVKFNKHKHKQSKWITNGILKSISYRDRLYYKYKRTPETSSHYVKIKNNLHQYNKILRQCIRQTKKLYFDNIFRKCKNDLRKTWGYINDILSRNKKGKGYPSAFIINNEHIEDYSIIVNEFNKFYTEIGPKLSSTIESIENKSFNDYLLPHQILSFEFTSVNPQDVTKIIDSLKPKTSHGLDKISSQFLKYIKNEISTPISKLINQSFSESVFPDQLKIAKIIPILKSKNDLLIENYRPISILPAISKIFEKVIYNQLTSHFDNNDLFYSSQYGFRKCHNTEFAAVELIDRITKQMDKNENPLNIFLDMSKAFDTLDHSILLEKLEHYGIKYKSLELLRSYFTNRYQFVDFNNTKSKLMPIKTGVPQGSILGPLFFIIYVNDLNLASSLFHPIIYADDVTLSTTIQAAHSMNTKKDINENINNELSKINLWLKLNKLSLNCTKTKAMLFHTPQKNIEFPRIRIQDQEIEYVKQFNFLGIVLDNNLKWKPQALNISKKLSKTIGIMNKLKHILPIEAMIHIYNSLVLSYLNYGLFLWGWQCQNIGKLVKKAVRIISKAKYNAHTGVIFQNYGLMNFENLCTLHDYKICYKLLNNTLPEYLSAITPSLQVSQKRYATRQNYSQKISIPFVRHEFARQSFSYRIPHILNNMHPSIKSKISTHSLIGFKLYVKKFFIDRYDTQCSIKNCFVCS